MAERLNKSESRCSGPSQQETKDYNIIGTEEAKEAEKKRRVRMQRGSRSHGRTVLHRIKRLSASRRDQEVLFRVI